MIKQYNPGILPGMVTNLKINSWFQLDNKINPTLKLGRFCFTKNMNKTV